jgi:hypothetical protein
LGGRRCTQGGRGRGGGAGWAGAADETGRRGRDAAATVVIYLCRSRLSRACGAAASAHMPAANAPSWRSSQSSSRSCPPEARPRRPSPSPLIILLCLELPVRLAELLHHAHLQQQAATGRSRPDPTSRMRAAACGGALLRASAGALAGHQLALAACGAKGRRSGWQQRPRRGGAAPGRGLQGSAPCQRSCTFLQRIAAAHPGWRWARQPTPP